ncbi:MAG TPA: Fic family protein [archaeon]|nr:Fic family protein [archaeon]
MVYIYKKRIGKKDYYYLRASLNKGRKAVTKDIAYLGNSAEDAKKALSEIKEHKDEIRKSYKKISSFLESNHYLELAKKNKLKHDDLFGEKLLEVEACKIHYIKEFARLDKLTKKQMINNFIIDFTYNTTSIEGNTIELREVHNLFEEGITPKGKTLREIYDLQNTKNVFEKLNLKDRVNDALVLKVHEGLMEKVDQRTGYRIKDVHIKDSHFESTPWQYISADMKELFKWYNREHDKLHPLALAAIFHHKFEKIHPFFDGNGRTGRILMNVILMKKDYPPIIIRKKYRAEYLDTLSDADEQNLFAKETNHYKKLIRFCSTEFTENYWNNFF